MFDFLEQTVEYFKSLKVITQTQKNVPILKSRNKTAFLGFIVCIRSLTHFYTEYVEEQKKMSVIPTYSLQQDPLEMVFGRIRARNGFNNNPNIQQFRGAFRKLLCNIKIDAPESGNCRIFEKSLPVDYLNSDVFTVSSKKSNLRFDDIKETYEEQQEDILQAVFHIDQIEINDSILESATSYKIAHTAKKIEEKLQKRLGCTECMEVFKSDTTIPSIGVGMNAMPCRSTFKICQHADKFLRIHDIRNKEES